MRELHTENIVEAVRELCKRINFNLNDDVISAIRKFSRKEDSVLGKKVLGMILENAREASVKKIPLCQDTGMVVVFLEAGQELNITGGKLEDAVNEGVRLSYREAYLRKSMVSDPLQRKNTKDNTPAFIHTQIVPGSTLSINIMAKGAGAENMSCLKMLKPADGEAGIRKFVLDTVKNAGANPCPPIIVGTGIGGSFDTAAVLAKKSLFRKIGSRNRKPAYSKLERQLLDEINRTGIGPQGFGGRTTALAVHIEVLPCHIAALPVAVNINCFTARHGSVEI